MKFLCPSCKAKYQIADEKVAGRSVRMKCRKCGYVIQVSSVAGLGDALPGSEPPPPGLDALSDASSAPPPSVAPSDLEFSTSESPPAAAPPAAAPPAAKTPAAPSAGSAPNASKPTASVPQRTEVKRPGVAPAARPTVAKPASAPIAKAPLPSPKAPLAGGAKPAPQKPSAPARPAPAPTAPSSAALKSEKLTMQGGVGSPQVSEALKSARDALSKPAPTVAAVPQYEEEESTRIADAGALAGAFSLAVAAAAEVSNPDSHSMPADEWFVGINGVPVGPIRLSELRSKAASGSVNRESLVWRDGFEDWRPLKTFPELVAVIDESVSSARASLTPFAEAAASELGTREPANPNAAPSVAPVSAVTAVSAGGETFSVSGVTGSALVTDELEAAGVPKRSGTSPAAWIAVAIALLFGLTIGFVVFNKAGASKTIEVVKYVDRPVPSAAAAPPPDVPAASEDVAANGDSKNTTKRPASTGNGSGKGPSASASGEPDKTVSGLPSLRGLGPNVRGPDGTAGPSSTVSGGGQLDSTQLSTTVARYKGSVQRACWQPALDTRDKDAPTSARVNVAIIILPSGSVQSATAGADPKGYRGLSQCISNRVRGWQFPPSGETTTVNVPFVFASQ